MFKIILIASILVSTSAMATGRHHKPPKPVIIDKTKTVVEKYYIDKTTTVQQTIDNTVTVQEVIDNTKTEQYYSTIDNTVTEQYYNNTVEQYENVFDDNRVSGGIAAAMAHAGIPDVHGKNTGIGASISTYRGINALAIGVVHYMATEPLTFQATLSVDDYAQDVSGVVGAIWGF